LRKEALTQYAIRNTQYDTMKSLRSRLTFTHALVALVAVIIVAVLATGLIRAAFNRFAPQTDADTLATQLSDRYQQWGSWDGVLERIRTTRQSGQFDQTPLGRLFRNRRVQILDSQGYLIFDSAGPVQRRIAPRIPGGAESPVIVDAQEVGSVVVSGQRAILNQAERSFLGVVYLSVIGGSVLAALVALAVALVITGRVTRPLRRLRDAAQRLAGGARHEPLAIPPDRELAELAISFNTMATELEHQQHLRRQLVADIAHELRTPLSVLRLQIESLEDGIEQPTPATLRSLAEEVSLLTRLVDDLRLLSLADAGQLSLAPEELDALTIVERAVAAAMPRARQQQIDLRAEPPTLPMAVVADPQRLTQILGNLIENALRYTPAGGTVTLRVSSELRVLSSEFMAQAPLTHNSQLTTRNWIVFEVADTGAGVPPEELPRIFERFYRTDKARARDTGGTGLGLAIVQRLVEMQGGRIWASSALGRGTTFHVALPAAKLAQSAPLQARSQAN
jgi:signal transduction histidine kinase